MQFFFFFTLTYGTQIPQNTELIIGFTQGLQKYRYITAYFVTS